MPSAPCVKMNSVRGCVSCRAAPWFVLNVPSTCCTLDSFGVVPPPPPPPTTLATEDGEVVVELPKCRHRYHKDSCLLPWLKGARFHLARGCCGGLRS
jgi:hypothetical protein